MNSRLVKASGVDVGAQASPQRHRRHTSRGDVGGNTRTEIRTLSSAAAVAETAVRSSSAESELRQNRRRSTRHHNKREDAGRRDGGRRNHAPQRPSGAALT